ncbi:MAG: PAS domain S-box protein [Proteobacteria bacterium]|nr:PAS domain S-box protein [Pseudomonadota bacterium]
MKYPSRTHQELLEEISALKQRIKELEQSGSDHKDESLRESIERFRAIADYTYNWENWIGPDGKLIWINPAVLRLTGYSVNECLAMNDFPIPLFDETDCERMTRIFTEVVQGASCNNVEFHIRCKDGSIKWGEVSCQPIYNATGTSIGHRSSICDITERKEAERALKDSEKKYRTIVENTNDAIYIHDLDGNIIDVNENACRMVGYTRDELIGANLAKIDKAWQFPENPECEQLIERGSTAFERENVRKDGSVVCVEVNVKIVNPEGKGIVQGFVKDITDRKQAEDELRQHHNHLEQLIKERTAELMQMNEKLKLEIIERNKAQTMLKGILDSLIDYISMIDEDFNIVWANEIGKELFGKDMIGRKCYAVYHGRKAKCTNCAISRTFQDGQVHEHESKIVDANGNALYFWCTSAVVRRYPDGRVKIVLEISRDISKRKLAEMALMKNKEDIEAKSKSLEELNAALRVLLHQREEDKINMEDRVASNVKRLVIPYIEKIKKGRLDPQQHSHFGILETNLNEIVSPFLHTIRQLNLTPRETQIASLIKDGKTTKEISEIIGAATSSIDSYRNNIRSKLGLNNKKINLHSYLQSLK